MKQLLIGLTAIFALTMPALALAQTSSFGNTPPSSSYGNSAPLSSNGSYKVSNPLGVNTICGLIKAVLGAALQIGIPIAVLFLVWAGFRFILARGNSGALEEAKKNLFYVIIGIGIFLGAWLMAQLIANTINNLQQGSSSAVNVSACN